MAKRSPSDTTPPPWKRANPKKKAGKKTKPLTAAQKQEARTRAREAGRRYPNLVDNMYVASKRTRKSASKRTAKKR
jgi:hypothetical protein